MLRPVARKGKYFKLAGRSCFAHGRATTMPLWCHMAAMSVA
jgi:hypothetical protein